MVFKFAEKNPLVNYRALIDEEIERVRSRLGYLGGKSSGRTAIAVKSVGQLQMGGLRVLCLLIPKKQATEV